MSKWLKIAADSGGFVVASYQPTHVSGHMAVIAVKYNQFADLSPHITPSEQLVVPE